VTVAVDTSVAVPLLVRSHRDHALAETYSVLTRLPGDARLAPADAARLLNARFAPPMMLNNSQARMLPDTLSRLGIAGGAVYDALVALAAKEHGATLATRDARARGTYDAVGVKVIAVT
jgi:toxin FitB